MPASLTNLEEPRMARPGRFTDPETEYIWEMDARWRFTAVNENFADHLGLPAEALVGFSRDEVVGATLVYDDPWAAHLSGFKGQTAFRDFLYFFTGPDGQTRYWWVDGMAAFDSRGGFNGYRGVARDVTQEVRMRRFHLDIATCRKAEREQGASPGC